MSTTPEGNVDLRVIVAGDDDLDRRVTVRVQGMLDAQDVQVLSDTLLDVLEKQPTSLTVDLMFCHWLGAAGLAALLRAAQSARRRGISFSVLPTAEIATAIRRNRATRCLILSHPPSPTGMDGL